MGILHTAIENNNFTQLEAALKIGSNPEERNSKGLSAMQFLLNQKVISIEMVDLLISYGASKNTRRPDDLNNLLHIAIINKDEKLLSYALDKEISVTAQNNRGHTPFQLFIQTYPDNLDLAERFIKLGANPDSLNLSNHNLLHIALQSGNEEKIKKAMGLGIKITTCFYHDQKTYSPLQWIMCHYPSYDSIIEEMLRQGANPNTTDDNLRTLLHLAVLNTDYKRVETLFSYNANVNYHDKTSHTPLKLLIETHPEALDIAELLIRHGGNKYTENSKGYNLLHLAILSADENRVERVLKLGIDVNQSSFGRYCPPGRLLFATKPINYKVARLLVEYGFDPKSLDSDHKNLLELAIKSKDKSLIAQALDLGIDPKKKQVHNKPPAIEQALLLYPDDPSIALFISDYKPNLVEIRSKQVETPPVSPSPCSSSSSVTSQPGSSSSNETAPSIFDELFNKPDSGFLICQFLLNNQPGQEVINRLGVKTSAKALVFRFISEAKDPTYRLELCEKALDSKTSLGAFFWVKRGMLFNPNPERGYLKKLSELKKATEAEIAADSNCNTNYGPEHEVAGPPC